MYILHSVHGKYGSSTDLHDQIDLPNVKRHQLDVMRKLSMASEEDEKLQKIAEAVKTILEVRAY